MKRFLINNWFLLLLIGLISWDSYISFNLVKERSKAVMESVDAETRLLDAKKELETLRSMLDIQIAKEATRFIETNKIYEVMLNKDLNTADIVYRAAKEFDLEPILLTVLINSESEFDINKTHKNSQVSGLGGIHSKYWKIPNKTIEEQIYACALVLNYYLTKYEGDVIKALTAYKGISQAGQARAKLVYEKYFNLKEKDVGKD